MYANQVDYTNWLRGRAATIPLTEFDFWAHAASQRIDQATFNRLHDEDVLAEYCDVASDVTCEIAEIIYHESTTGDRVLSSMSIDGYSEHYADSKIAKPQDRISAAIKRGFSVTGLLYRGV